MPPCTGISKTRIREVFRGRTAERHGTTYFSSPRTLIGRFTNYKAQGRAENTRGHARYIASINMPAFALSSFARLNVNDAKRY